MPFFLPGRDPDPERMEAERAVSILKDAEEVKDSDPEFLSMVGEEINRQRDVLERLAGLVGDMDPDEVDLIHPEGEQGSRTVEDFINRLRKSKFKEEARTQESASEKRKRLQRIPVDFF